MRNLGLKVNLDLWNVSIAICHSRLNIPSGNNDLGFNSLKICTFQFFPI